MDIDLKEKKTENKEKGFSLQGEVVSVKMKDTVVVEVSRFAKIPKYEKFVKSSKRYKAQDKGNTKKLGDIVTIVPCRPISKDKRFKVVG